ncbi:class I SAM-dependent methyltransferase [Filimonas effusa]|uniref:Methyltransferase domain-containing protein n=1 Tax=Filimonas effusa TaxID=2508721 RepID=A0A4Q1D742_9BACT|nr:methyltransferase domain-containing protein [Filimonas effusa]RXK83551.1 methyltransferase domain-containing protein [Filimonas effusa]
MKDVLGKAIHDYYQMLKMGKLWIHNKYGPKEEMPVDVYFRREEDMPEMELLALKQCTGKVLDVGAGAGSHALWLQQQGITVTALDISPAAAAVMEARGVQQVVAQDFFTVTSGGYDTLLLLMNGIGIAGTIEGLHRFLQHARTLLQPGGQLLFDSSDIAYLYEGRALPESPYYGEIAYRYEYKGQKTDWFSWLYIDKNRLEAIAAAEGWRMELLQEDEYGQYLVKLTMG